MITQLSASLNQRSCVVIGGGPAGSASAISFARQGWKVTLLERRYQIEQKICGECLSPPSLTILKNLGVWDRIPKQDIRDLQGISLIGALGSRCDLDFGIDKPFTIPRPVLDQALMDEAKSIGVDVRMGMQAVRLFQRSSSFTVATRDGQKFESDFLIAADGRHSWVARELKLTHRHPHSLKHAAVMGHFTQPKVPLNSVEMHVTNWGYVGLNPLSDGTVNTIAVMAPALLKTRLGGRGSSGLMNFLKAHVLGEFSSPSLTSRMNGSSPSNPKTWTVSPIAWMPKKIVGRHCALVGDSAGFIDPFTGEGIYHSLVSAWQLGALMATHNTEKALFEYSKWHQKIFGPEETFCLLLQKLLPFSKLSDYAIGQLGRKSKLNRILAEAVADRISTREILNPLFWAKVLWPTQDVHSKKGISSL